MEVLVDDYISLAFYISANRWSRVAIIYSLMLLVRQHGVYVVLWRNNVAI